MKKTVITFGLIAGLIISVLLADKIGSGHILIPLVTTVFYVATWEILYFNFIPHFMDSYFAAQIHKVQSSGLDAATTAAKVADIQHSQQLYQNPFVNMAY